MTDTTRPPTAAAQRIVTAMWTFDRAATAKEIAKAAAVGYSTVSPVLRHLLATHQAVKSAGDDGSTRWQLDAQTRPPAAAAGTASGATPHPQKPTRAEDGGGAADVGSSPDTSHHRDDPAALSIDSASTGSGTTDTVDTRGPHRDPLSAPDSPPLDPTSHTEIHAVPAAAEPAKAHAEADAPAAAQSAAPDSISSDPSDVDSSPTTATRGYRKPDKPRRPKGALRAAIQSALANEPDRAFRVGDMCKIIDGADPDGQFNKAGPGAVVNALDKLANHGYAIRVSETPASYQFQAPPAGADNNPS
jgi:hypothetical protein